MYLLTYYDLMALGVGRIDIPLTPEKLKRFVRGQSVFECLWLVKFGLL